MNTAYWHLLSMQITILILLTFSLNSCIPTTPYRESVLIVNTNNSVGIYANIHQEFKSELSNSDLKIKIKDFDLDGIFSTDKLEKEIKIFLRPNVVYTIGSQAYALVSEIIENQPEPIVIFSGMLNWRKFKRNLNANTYGIVSELPANMQLFIFKQFFPEINSVGILYSANYNQEWFKYATSQAKEIGVKLHGKALMNSNDINGALKEILPDVDAIWLVPDPIISENIHSKLQILKEANIWQKPIFTYNPKYINEDKYGVVLTMTADVSAIGEQAANLVKDILKKQLIPEKVQFPVASPHIIVNLKKVHKYGIKFNEAARTLVDKIIE